MFMCMAGNLSDSSVAMVSARVHRVTDFDKRQRQHEEIGRVKREAPKRTNSRLRSRTTCIPNGHVTEAITSKLRGGMTFANRSIVKDGRFGLSGKFNHPSDSAQKHANSSVDNGTDLKPGLHARLSIHSSGGANGDVDRKGTAWSSPTHKTSNNGSPRHKYSRSFDNLVHLQSKSPTRNATTVRAGRPSTGGASGESTGGILKTTSNRLAACDPIAKRNLVSSCSGETAKKTSRKTSSLDTVLGQISALSAMRRKSSYGKVLSVKNDFEKRDNGVGKCVMLVGNSQNGSLKCDTQIEKVNSHLGKCDKEIQKWESSIKQCDTQAGKVNSHNGKCDTLIRKCDTQRAMVDKQIRKSEKQIVLCGSQDMNNDVMCGKQAQFSSTGPSGRWTNAAGETFGNTMEITAKRAEEKRQKPLSSRKNYTRMINEKLNSAISSKLSPNGRKIDNALLNEKLERHSNGLVRRDFSRIPVQRLPNRCVKRDNSVSSGTSACSSNVRTPADTETELGKSIPRPKSDQKASVLKASALPISGIIRYRKSTVRSPADKTVHKDTSSAKTVKDDLLTSHTPGGSSKEKPKLQEDSKKWTLGDRWKSQVNLNSDSCLVGGHFPVRRAKSSVISMAVIRGNPDGQSATDVGEGESTDTSNTVKKVSRSVQDSKPNTFGWLGAKASNRPTHGTEDSTREIGKKLSHILTVKGGKDINIDKSSKLKDQTMDVDGSVDGSNCSQQSTKTDTPVVVRQCRIGTALAFGVVSLDQPNGNGYTDSQGLVTIRMKPDFQGRFGFNVKGGADQGMPIIVSRVAPNTPADLCIPRLNEGDQVLFINGRDVSQHTHEQVVMFIRASRETHSGELVLVVRPNVYLGEDTIEEPDFMYIPETHQITSSAGGNVLEASLILLQEGLESGAALAQFEQLYRKKMGMTMNAARLVENVPKNRYRDISPYDQSRVVLKEGTLGDYINANYVNMEIPGSGIINRYIAAQGPLPNTCVDFWQMVWEQQASLVVMLTAKVERGRQKCHQYWPDLYETADFGTLQITCVKEEETPSFAFRDFNLTHVETNEERHIVHMQYIAWPDHGVPDDSSDFLDFVLKVRQNRVGMVDPTIVHCSAGIGRTGVLITMETAMCLIEANQPVYPLSIVRQMRDQRAMLIQTSSQYKFVCEAILRVFHEGLVKPLEDYKR